RGRTAQCRDGRVGQDRPASRRDRAHNDNRHRAPTRLSDGIRSGWLKLTRRESGGGAKTRGDRAEHLDGDVAVLMQDVAELFVPEYETAHRRRRHHGRRTRSVVQKRDLAKELAGTEHPLAVPGLDPGGTFEDDEEIPAGFPL